LTGKLIRKISAFFIHIYRKIKEEQVIAIALGKREAATAVADPGICW